MFDTGNVETDQHALLAEAIPLTLGPGVPAFRWQGTGPSPQPTIVSVHGLGGNKADINPAFVRYLTSLGISVVTIDAYGHGDRAPEGGFDDAAYSEPGIFVELFARSGRDLVGVVEDLRDRYAVPAVGLRGGSVGGFVVLTAMGLSADACAVLSICGGADLINTNVAALNFTSYEVPPHIQQLVDATDPYLNAAAFAPTPVLMIHGLYDDVVPIAGHRSLYERIAPDYSERPEDCVFITHAGKHPTPLSLEEYGLRWLAARVQAAMQR